MFSRAIALRPNNLQLLLDRASAHMSLGRPQSAIDDLNAVLAKSPESIEALSLRGENYEELGEKDKAEADSKQMIRLMMQRSKNNK